MYKEFRSHPSTPEVWAANFAGRLNWQDALGRIRLRLDPRWRSIKKAVDKPARILDVGCGLGQWVLYLNKRGYTALGLDYSKEMIDNLKERRPEISWLEGLSTEIPLPAESVDAVITWGVIEHDEQGPQAALAEVLRILKPGGLLFATVPADTPAMRRTSQVQFPEPNEGEVSTFFQYFFSDDELGETLLRAGFQVEEISKSSRHFSLCFPRLYAAAARRSSLLRDSLTLLLKPITFMKRDSHGMVMGVGRKISPKLEPVVGELP